MEILGALIVLIVYVFVMALVNYYRSENVCYMGLKACPVCKKLTHFYLKENGNHNVTFIECNSCHRKLQIGEELSACSRLYYFNVFKNIPSPQECVSLSNMITKRLETILREFIENVVRSGKDEAIQIFNYDIKSFEETFFDYTNNKKYNQKYVSELYVVIYNSMLNNLAKNLKEEELK